jgi:hypothetical protein
MEEHVDGRTRESSFEQAATASARSLPSADLAYQLRFELLRHISTMSFLSAGGAITLLQTTLADQEVTVLALSGLAFLIGAALTAFTAQSFLVDRLGEEIDGDEREYLLPPIIPRTRKIERFNQLAAGAQLGLGLGLFAAYASGAL